MTYDMKSKFSNGDKHKQIDSHFDRSQFLHANSAYRSAKKPEFLIDENQLKSETIANKLNSFFTVFGTNNGY